MRCFILGFVLGCYWVHQQATLYTVWAYLAAACALLLMICLNRKIQSVMHDAAFVQGALYVLMGILLALLWVNAYASYLLKDTLPRTCEKKEITVVGVVDDLPAISPNRTQLVLSVESAQYQGKSIPSFPKRIQLSWYRQHRFSKVIHHHAAVLPGQRWQFTVRLKRPHGLVNPYKRDSEITYLEKHIQATGYVIGDRNQLLTPFVFSVKRYIHHLRFLLRDRLHQQLSVLPYSGIMVALLTGDQSEIQPDTWEIFRQTGISHLVAISGMHVMLVAGFLSKIFAWLWRKSFYTSLALPLILPESKVRMIAAVVIAAGYVLMAGLGIPAQRAFLMLFITAWGMLSARSVSASLLLSIALFVVLLFDPWALYSAGCWLSFMAVSILFYSTYAARCHNSLGLREERPKNAGRIKRCLVKGWQQCRQFCATQYVLLLGLFPVSVVVFGQYSIVSPITNALAIPVVTLTVVPLLLLGCVLPDGLAHYVWYTGHTILHWLMDCMVQCASWSWSMSYFAVPNRITTGFAMLGIAILLLPKDYPYRHIGWFGFLPFLFYPAQHPVPGDVWLTALDVGQGMAILVETAEHRLLYDTGGKLGDESDLGKTVILPYLMARGINKLDTLLISHQDTDHSGGARSILKEIPVQLLLSSLPEGHHIHALTSVSRRCEAGQRWVWDGVQFEVLHPLAVDYQNPRHKPNAMSCVLSVKAHNKQILLAGDIGKKQEKALIKRLPASQLKSWGLIAPHHGSNTSSSEPFLRIVDPQWSIFQMGYLNQFHHPHPLVFKRYQALKIIPFRSDEQGAVHISISEKRATIEGQKTKYPHYWYQ